MSQERWTLVDLYLGNQLLEDDADLAATLVANAEAGMPAHDVSPTQGRFLQLLARIAGARHILEIGRLGGYSTIWLARGLPAGGRITTLEIDAARAEVARANLARCGLDGIVEIRVGAALDSLQALKEENAGPYDLIFIDADKPNNPRYLEWAVELSRPGSVIIGDNVIRDGAVADSHNADPNVVGVRRFLEDIGRHPRLSATALQTVGVKGYDGSSLALVLPLWPERDDGGAERDVLSVEGRSGAEARLAAHARAVQAHARRRERAAQQPDRALDATPPARPDRNERPSAESPPAKRGSTVGVAGAIQRLVSSDEAFMRLAMEQAERARGHTGDNPWVGCAIVSAEGQVLGVGYTRGPGEHHAEISAAADAASRGHSIVGATLYSTLEPCSFHGRTPACAHSIVARGLRRVVTSIRDPNPKVDGAGIRILQQAGIDVLEGVCQAEVSRQLGSWIVRHHPSAIVRELEAFGASGQGGALLSVAEKYGVHPSLIAALVGQGVSVD